MRAATFEKQGPAHDVLRVVDMADPEPGPGEVRIRVRSSGVNPTDWKSRSGGRPMAFEVQIPNHDGAGEIDRVGDGVSPSAIGRRVWFTFAAWGRPSGSAAQYLCLPAGEVYDLADGVPFSRGAGLGIPYITAHRCLMADGPIRGRTILVAGGAGAVGNAAIALAVWSGARVVATVSSPEKGELAHAAGADAVVNYRDPDATDQLRAAAPDGVFRVVEVALGANIERDLAVLESHGAASVYATDGPPPTLPLPELMRANARIEFVLMYYFTPAMISSAVTDINAMLRAGHVSPVPEHEFTLDEIAAAHDAVQAAAVGKVVVTPW